MSRRVYAVTLGTLEDFQAFGQKHNNNSPCPRTADKKHDAAVYAETRRLSAEDADKYEGGREERGVREVTRSSPGPLAGSSGNAGSSSDNQPAPGRWRWRRAAWESPPERDEQSFKKADGLHRQLRYLHGHLSISCK